jgi:hypothetical protein
MLLLSLTHGRAFQEYLGACEIECEFSMVLFRLLFQMARVTETCAYSAKVADKIAINYQ